MGADDGGFLRDGLELPLQGGRCGGLRVPAGGCPRGLAYAGGGECEAEQGRGGTGCALGHGRSLAALPGCTGRHVLRRCMHLLWCSGIVLSRE